MVEKLDEREKLLSKEWQSLVEVVSFYLDVEDSKRIEGMEFSAALTYVYDRLLHDGFDPDEVLEGTGVKTHEI